MNYNYYKDLIITIIAIYYKFQQLKWVAFHSKIIRHRASNIPQQYNNHHYQRVGKTRKEKVIVIVCSIAAGQSNFYKIALLKMHTPMHSFNRMTSLVFAYLITLRSSRRVNSDTTPAVLRNQLILIFFSRCSFLFQKARSVTHKTFTCSISYAKHNRRSSGNMEKLGKFRSSGPIEGYERFNDQQRIFICSTWNLGSGNRQ